MATADEGNGGLAMEVHLYSGHVSFGHDHMEVQPWKFCGGRERREQRDEREHKERGEMRENVRTNKAKNNINK